MSAHSVAGSLQYCMTFKPLSRGPHCRVSPSALSAEGSFSFHAGGPASAPPVSSLAYPRYFRQAYICSHCVSGTVCARLCASDGILRLSSTAFDRQQVACISSAGEGISRGSRGRPGRWQSAGSAQMKLRKSASRGSRIKTGKSAFKQAVFAYSESKRRIKNGFCGDMPEQSSRPA